MGAGRLCAFGAQLGEEVVAALSEPVDGGETAMTKLAGVPVPTFGRTQPAWLAPQRGLATRYDKTRESYHAAVTIASLLLWI
ncbi:hypothetical protein A6A06_15380 [Streptomyces sp. CB02923]|nr:hypothetical protein A6A06_15380 [Streptomyces sp. CB02923]